VKNFAQSPEEWIFWWFKNDFVAGNQNVMPFAATSYLIINCDLPVGTKVDLEFDYKTNNENDNGFISYSVAGGKFQETGLNPRWKMNFEFDRIKLENAEVTNVSTFAKANAEMASAEKKNAESKDSACFNTLPPHINGVIMRVESLDAGAHMIVKNMTIFSKTDKKVN
jgi:hypothetical protein